MALRREADQELAAYLDGLRSWMAGNFYWSLETGRYNLAGQLGQLGPLGQAGQLGQVGQPPDDELDLSVHSLEECIAYR
jgi:hypothetical protein